MAKEFYFNRFEHRRPYSSIQDSPVRTLMFQFCGITCIALGMAYLTWRWCHSLNPDALWFAIPLVLAETFSFFGTVVMVFSFWSNKDGNRGTPVRYRSDIEAIPPHHDRPLIIDVFIATYNEDVELVRLSIQDAKKLLYPFPDVEIKIYVLDDGKRDGRNKEKENMKKVAEEEGVGYLLRETNAGYKAGNLKNGLEHTNGDLFAILDADTRVFPEFLINTTGYFRKTNVAWVQTPQWFYDTTEEEILSDIINTRLKVKSSFLARCITFLFGKIKVNEDLFGNDPRLFYDVILRRRNYFNAAFCCGAGSIHRREAIMGLAVKDFADTLAKLEETEPVHSLHQTHEALLHQEIMPFKFHASEDIYTSILLHSDRENGWESIQHPEIECKMLSPQDLDSWIKQRQRYAAGTLDIAFHDNPVFKKGLTFGQKMCYLCTIWSYFSPLWIVVFLLSPLVFFYTFQVPVKAYNFDFFKFFLPFQIMNTLTLTLACWGINTKRGDQYYISGFWFMLQAFIEIILGKKIKFNVTPKNTVTANNLHHILPHIIIIALGIGGIVFHIVLIILGKHPHISGFAANTFWCLFNIFNLTVIIRAAKWRPQEVSE